MFSAYGASLIFMVSVSSRGHEQFVCPRVTRRTCVRAPLRARRTRQRLIRTAVNCRGAPQRIAVPLTASLAAHSFCSVNTRRGAGSAAHWIDGTPVAMGLHNERRRCGAEEERGETQMRISSNGWAVVLAAGSGTRLSGLTADGTGVSVPKQFCSLNGGSSLLEEALSRAAAVATPAQTVVVVAAEHRRHWQHALADLPPHNVIVQPRNRGTANGILLAVSAILERDADAIVAIVPSDHYVEREDVLGRALQRAMATVGADRAASIGFLGVEPESPDPELGYIVRGEPLGDGSCTVTRFVEKPPRSDAVKLLKRRALWNSFIIVARAAALVDLIALRYPVEVTAFRSLWQQVAWSARLSRELEKLYDKLPEIDFSRQVVEGTSASLHVVPVAACGWSDLGTPQRVAECLGRLGKTTSRPHATTHHFNLAEAYVRLMGSASAQTA
jgi:mannose-1-phosphate guanylyltransferase